MDAEFTQEEREVIKLVGFFNKKAMQLIEEKRLPAEYNEMLDTAGKLVEQIQLHAKNRQTIINERKQLQSLVKDNAVCPKCSSNEKLKLTGTDRSEQGWLSNKYKCRNCNIEFVWNTPNNPWHMVPYVEDVISKLRIKNSEEPNEDIRNATEAGIAQMEANLSKLKPVVEASDLDMADLEEREKQMAEVVHKFKKHLLIEKIKMED